MIEPKGVGGLELPTGWATISLNWQIFEVIDVVRRIGISGTSGERCAIVRSAVSLAGDAHAVPR